jgi:hypothetical protein
VARAWADGVDKLFRPVDSERTNLGVLGATRQAQGTVSFDIVGYKLLSDWNLGPICRANWMLREGAVAGYEIEKIISNFVRMLT